MSLLLCASPSIAEHGKKWFDAGLLASLACLLDNLCHASASIAKKWKIFFLDAHLLASQSLAESMRGAAHVETNLEPNSGNTAPPF